MNMFITKTKTPTKVLILVIAFLTLFTYPMYSYGAPPEISAPIGISIDYETGAILYQHNPHQIAYPASTTKVLTAIIALEMLDLDEVITVDYDIFVPGSSMHLVNGESFTVKELIQALLIRSGNDVSEVLAKRISGSVEEFSILMNQRAKELGALNTHFTNPHGLPDDEHVTTAYDLAVISRHAMGNEVFREIVATSFVSFDETEQTPERRYYRNTNRFLWGTGAGHQILLNGRYINIKYDIVDGIKTGFTRAAQNTLISSAVKDDRRVIAVVLGAQGVNIYADSRAIIDYSFDNYDRFVFAEDNFLIKEISIRNALLDAIPIYTGEPLVRVLPIGFDASTVVKDIQIFDDIVAPMEAGTAVGKITFSAGNQVLGEVSLVVLEDVEEKPLFFRKRRGIIIAIGILLFIISWQMFINYLRYKKRRRQKYAFGSSYSFSKSLIRRR